MQHLPLTHFGRPDKDGLLEFLRFCQHRAKSIKHRCLASITLPSEYLDPLAVLQTVNDPTQEHCYFEQASKHQGVACAEPVLLFEGSGESRFDDLKSYANSWFSSAVSIGDDSLPWSGPHFFVESTFEHEVDVDFIPPLLAFVPRWQVGWCENNFSATANIVVSEDDDLEALIEPIWRAHMRFSSFDFEDEADFGVDEVFPKADVKSIRKRESEVDYIDAVERALTAIEKGDVQKVVIARRLLLESQRPFEPLEILNLLRKRYPDCFTFSFQNNKGASLIGATPEKLICVKDGVFSTEALAGSIERGDNARKDAFLTKTLLNSVKDRNEHGLVLKFLQDELLSMGLKVEFAKAPEVLQLRNIQHLRVSLSGLLEENIHLLDLVKKLHPTPALGGYPQDASMSVINDIEGVPRGVYSGLTGWFDAMNNGEMAVNIRCAKVEGLRATLYAGAGIVHGSDPQKELKETELKLNSLFPYFTKT